MTKLFDGDTFEHNGRTFRVYFPYDAEHGAPWKECDGHGPVSEWTRRDKLPGERILATHRGMLLYYDVAEAIRIAKRDGWNAEPYVGTRGEAAARAVEVDFHYLRRWCNDEWHYVGVVVTHPGTGKRQSIWGIESDAYDYLASTAHDLAREICGELDTEFAEAVEASRPDMSASFTPGIPSSTTPM